VAGAALLRRSELVVDARGAAVLVGVGGLTTAVFQVAYQMATEAAGVPVTVALLYLAPAIVLAASGPLLGERPSGRRVAFGLLSVVGVWLTVLHARGADLALPGRGVTWGLLAAVGYAGYTLFGRHAAPRWGATATVVYS